jgi:hypothetical protein
LGTDSRVLFVSAGKLFVSARADLTTDRSVGCVP